LREEKKGCPSEREAKKVCQKSEGLKKNPTPNPPPPPPPPPLVPVMSAKDAADCHDDEFVEAI